MQRMFAEDTPWRTPWMTQVAPKIKKLIAAHPNDTVFTRFLPASTPQSANGRWRLYYEKWKDLTLERIDPKLLDIMSDLLRENPDSPVFDKTTYSPWIDPGLADFLDNRGIDTLIVTGAETEVCIAATVLGAVDRGYRVVVATDGICSSSDKTHDAMVDIYHERYSVHVSPATIRTILEHWPSD